MNNKLFWPIRYIIATYLYWPTMKLMGCGIIGSFHFRDDVPGIHGTFSFSSLVLFSPISVPLDLALAILAPTIGYVEEDLGSGLRNTALVWSAFCVAAVLSILLTSGIFRTMGKHVKSTRKAEADVH